jgi:hypothetical protein
MADGSSRVDGVDDVLVRLQRALAEHPEALRALTAALASEGRAYAETAEGRELRERLVQSEYVTRLRTAWDIVAFDVGGHSRGALFPSSALGALLQSILRPGFEAQVHGALRSGRSKPRPPEPRGEGG